MHCAIAIIDLNARLHGTVCLYEDEPYLICIDERSGPERILLHDLVNKDFVKRVSHEDPRFDVATPPLGYIQVKKNRIVYSERLPFRQFKQGVVAQVISYKYYSEQFRMTLHSECFRFTMMKKYAPFKDIISLVAKAKEYSEYALSNDVAIIVSDGVVKIYFKNEEVAFSTVNELKKEKPVIHVPSSTRAWIVDKYLSQFDWEIVQ